MRFSEDGVYIRDIYTFDNKIKILVSRDNEEFIVYEFEDFKTESYW